MVAPVGDETMIAGTIVEVGKAVVMSAGSLKTKVRPIALISLRTCPPATAEGLTFTAPIATILPSTAYFTALTLFDRGAYISFVNREVAKWLKQQQCTGAVAGATSTHSSRHNIPASSVGLAGTQLR